MIVLEPTAKYQRAMQSGSASFHSVSVEWLYDIMEHGYKDGQERMFPAPRMRRDEAVKITLRDVLDGTEYQFALTRGSPMSRVFNAYAAREGTPVSDYAFLLDGALIYGEDTPETLELDENDVIAVHVRKDIIVTVC